MGWTCKIGHTNLSNGWHCNECVSRLERELAEARANAERIERRNEGMINPRPIRSWDADDRITKNYLKQVSVATCENCRDRSAFITGDKHQKPMRLKFKRVPFPPSYKLCPVCQNALFWERVAPSDAAYDSALPQLGDKALIAKLQ